MKRSVLFIPFWLCAILVHTSSAQVPSTISYQGFLESGGLPVDGNVAMVVRLYAQESGGAPAWSQSFAAVTVAKGVYTLQLNVASIPFDTQYWLETEIDGSVSSTRTALTSVPYSLGPWTTGASGPAAGDLKNSSRSTDLAPIPSIYYLNGNVGLGTSSPASKLDVQAAGGDLFHLTGYQPFITFYDNNNSLRRGAIQEVNGGLNTFTDNYLIGADATGFTRLDNSGNFGIGAADPLSKLDVRSLGSDLVHITGYSPSMTFYDSNHGYRRSAFQAVDGGLNVFCDAYLTGTSPFGFTRLDNSGNFGIGSANPTAKLEVASGSGDIFHMIGYEPYLTFYDSNHGYRRSSIQAVDGGMNVFTDSYLASGNTLACMRLSYDGNFGIGTLNPQVKLEVLGHTRTQVLEITGGGDFSENFDVSDETVSRIEPGMVVSIDPANPGKLMVSDRAYDNRVAGIVSGAGGILPGMVMGQQGSIVNGKYPVALTGRVYCRADATTAPIEPGDLLTTSSIAGRAMKVIDPSRAGGAIIGKAMTGLKAGTGLVLVLVTLQ